IRFAVSDDAWVKFERSAPVRARHGHPARSQRMALGMPDRRVEKKSRCRLTSGARRNHQQLTVPSVDARIAATGAQNRAGLVSAYLSRKLFTLLDCVGVSLSDPIVKYR